MVVRTRGKVSLQKREEDAQRKEEKTLTDRYKWLMSRVKRNSLIQ